MPESINRLVLGKLNHLAYHAQLYQVADQAIATASDAACFAFWSGSSKGLPVRLISVEVSASAAIQLAFGRVLTDPAFTAGNASSNLYFGGASAQAKNEAQVTTAVTISDMLAKPNMAANTSLELLSPAVAFLPPNSGVVVQSPNTVVTVTVKWLWAEIPPERDCAECAALIIVPS